MKKFKKEILLFILLFITLSLIVHSDKWFLAPMEHLSSLTTHPMPYHPFLYTAIIFAILYIIIYILKVITRVFKRLATK